MFGYPDRLDLDIKTCEPAKHETFNCCGNADVCYLVKQCTTRGMLSSCFFRNKARAVIICQDFLACEKMNVLDLLLQFFDQQDLICIFRYVFDLTSDYVASLMEVTRCIDARPRVEIECEMITIQHRKYVFQEATWWFYRTEEEKKKYGNGPVVRCVSKIARKAALTGLLTHMTYERRNLQAFVRNFSNYLTAQWMASLHFLARQGKEARNDPRLHDEEGNKIWKLVWQALDFLYQWRTIDSLGALLQHTLDYVYENPHAFLDYRLDSNQNEDIIGGVTCFSVPELIEERAKFFPGAPYWLNNVLSCDAVATYEPSLFETVLGEKHVYPLLVTAIRDFVYPRYRTSKRTCGNWGGDDVRKWVYGPVAMQYIAARPFTEIKPFNLSPLMISESGRSEESWKVRLNWLNRMARHFEKDGGRPVLWAEQTGESQTNWISEAMFMGWTDDRPIIDYLEESDHEDKTSVDETDTDEDVFAHELKKADKEIMRERLVRVVELCESKKEKEAADLQFKKDLESIAQWEEQKKKEQELVVIHGPRPLVPPPEAQFPRTENLIADLEAQRSDSLTPGELLAQDPNEPMEEIDLTCEEDM
jgi:hypothetical protein